MEKPTGRKSVGTRRGMPCHSNNPGQHLPASRHVGYVLHYPYIWQPLIRPAIGYYFRQCYSLLKLLHSSPVHPLSCLNFTLMCWTAQFYSNAPSHVSLFMVCKLHACSRLSLIATTLMASTVGCRLAAYAALTATRFGCGLAA